MRRNSTLSLGHLISQMDVEQEALTHPLLEEREVKHVCIISVSGDRGLCGSFNSNVIRTTTQQIQHYEEAVLTLRLSVSVDAHKNI